MFPGHIEKLKGTKYVIGKGNLKWYGHLIRMNYERKAKVYGAPPEGRTRRGKLRKECEQYIGERERESKIYKRYKIEFKNT